MRRICISLAAAMGLWNPAFAQDPAPDHDGLRKLQATMENALNSRDINTILENVDENVIFTTMNGDVAHGREGIRKYFADMMEGPNKVVESITSDFIPDDLSVFHGTDMAIAFGKTNDHYVLAGGKKLDIQARWSATLVRKADRWLVANFHYSANVFDNPILLMQRQALLTYGGGAALLLVVIAFFVGRRTGKRPA